MKESKVASVPLEDSIRRRLRVLMAESSLSAGQLIPALFKMAFRELTEAQVRETVIHLASTGQRHELQQTSLRLEARDSRALKVLAARLVLPLNAIFLAALSLVDDQWNAFLDSRSDVRGLSMGQFIALSLLSPEEREQELLEFVPDPSWTAEVED